MEKFILRSFILVASLTTLACGPQAQPEPGLDSYVYVNGQFTQQDSVALEGSGTVRFSTQLPGLNSTKSLEMTGELYENGSVTAIFYSDDANLSINRGVMVRFLRTASAHVTGVVGVNGNNVGIQDTRLAYVTPGAFSLIVQVQNTPSSSRVILWKKDSVTYSLANVEFDTQVNSHLSGAYPLGGGVGLYAGLQLNKARLTAAFLGDAK